MEDREFDEVITPQRYREPDESIVETPHSWELLDSTDLDFKRCRRAAMRLLVRRGLDTRVVRGEITRLLAETGRRWRPRAS